jgi:Uma2 family endonuclease
MSEPTTQLEPSSLDREEFARLWEEVVNDPVLSNLPYRMEMNKWGHIEMTPPPSPRHMDVSTRLAILLREVLGTGKVFPECAIVTSGGVKVADVVWCSDEYVKRHREVFSSWRASVPEAPELCIEVMSPSNLAAELKEKVKLYLEAGAKETWIVYPDFRIEIYDADGPRPAPRLPIDLDRIRRSLMSE